MIYLDNFVKAEKSGYRLLYYFQCERCGNEYTRKSTANNIGLCSKCRLANKEIRAQQARENAIKKGKEEVKRDLKELIKTIDNNQIIQIDGHEYIKKKAVVDSISEYFKQ